MFNQGLYCCKKTLNGKNFVLMLSVLVNNFSVVSRQFPVFRNKQRIKCLAQDTTQGLW